VCQFFWATLYIYCTTAPQRLHTHIRGHRSYGTKGANAPNFQLVMASMTIFGSSEFYGTILYSSSIKPNQHCELAYSVRCMVILHLNPTHACNGLKSIGLNATIMCRACHNGMIIDGDYRYNKR